MLLPVIPAFTVRPCYFKLFVLFCVIWSVISGAWERSKIFQWSLLLRFMPSWATKVFAGALYLRIVQVEDCADLYFAKTSLKRTQKGKQTPGQMLPQPSVGFWQGGSEEQFKGKGRCAPGLKDEGLGRRRQSVSLAFLQASHPIWHRLNHVQNAA